jgi:hypothetical protein
VKILPSETGKASYRGINRQTISNNYYVP